MKALGLGFIALGILALVLGSMPYGRGRPFMDLAPNPPPAADHTPVPISPVVGGLTVVSGLLLLLVPSRRTAS